MRNDIVIEVIDKIKSGKPILVMQAILTGIEAKITDEAFVEEIKNNKENETRFAKYTYRLCCNSCIRCTWKRNIYG